MSYQVIEMKCPSCGAGVSLEQKKCEWCGNPIMISTFNSVCSMSMPEVSRAANTYRQALEKTPDNQELNNSIAMCYLKLKLYDKALPAFEKAMKDNFDNSETFFYAAICLLQGKKAFLHQRTTIDKILENINAALMIEPKGIYYYFLAYIKYDYFARKSFVTTPTYVDYLNDAQAAGVSEYDKAQLYNILGVNKPECL